MSNNTTVQPDIAAIQQKLAGYLEPSGWKDKLKTFVLSGDFAQILNKLVEMSGSGQRFTPPLKYIFRSFAACPYNELKVVFVGPGPYQTFRIDDQPLADGLLYSHQPVTLPADGKNWVKWENDIFREAAGNRNANPDLTHWATQGILLLNSALTATVDTETAHYDLYNGFIAFVLDTLNTLNQGLIFVFIGEEATGFSELINPQRHFVYTLPKVGLKNNLNYIFSQIDAKLHDHYKTKINW
jgi:uracil-DNA glycosylase